MTQIGTSTLDVYPLCLGTNSFGWTASRETSWSILDEYTESGGNFLDTADVYTAWIDGNQGGESESIIGGWLSGKRREEIVLATKVAKLPGFRGLSAGNVAACVDASLSRLQTDYVDLYYAHEYDANTPLEESVAAFAKLQQVGKIREVGLSNFDSHQVKAWIDEADRQGVARPVALQPHYNLVWREPFESTLAVTASEYDLAVMPYWSLAAGLLTGKYAAAKKIVGDRASSVSSHANERAFEVVDTVEEIASALNVEPASVAIAWLLTRPVVTAPIASARTLSQVPPLFEGVTISLSDDEVQRLDQLSNGLGEQHQK